MSRFIEFGDAPGQAMTVNNADWLLDLNYINLLREVGTCFTVNEMLAAKAYKLRWEKGLTFFEFNYMIMQAYDFYMLYKKYNCRMQFGGDDQWSNMLAGRELIRRKIQGSDSEAMTITLLTNSEGNKMGKTAKGAVWLDPDKTSPFDFYQYWRNVGDADVIKCLKLLTFLPLEQIAEYEKREGQELNAVKEVLAYELTSMVHGEEEAKHAQEGARKLFAAGKANTDDLEAHVLDLSSFRDEKVDLIGAMVAAKLAVNRSDARRNIEQGGVLVDGEKETDFRKTYTKDQIAAGLVVKRGKKNFKKVVLG
jgi:tyrosyl-tRNA synthetase